MAFLPQHFSLIHCGPEREGFFHINVSPLLVNTMCFNLPLSSGRHQCKKTVNLHVWWNFEFQSLQSTCYLLFRVLRNLLQASRPGLVVAFTGRDRGHFDDTNFAEIGNINPLLIFIWYQESFLLCDFIQKTDVELVIAKDIFLNQSAKNFIQTISKSIFVLSECNLRFSSKLTLVST